ncbi:MAG: sugar phosphate isomerase/epimerase family protein [Lachnospiraceae bacterium]
MNRIGVRGHDFGKMSIKDLPSTLRALGFQAAQLAPAKAFEGVNSFEDITEHVLEQCREEFLKNDIEISVYGCYVEIGEREHDKRRQQVEQFIRGMHHCKRIGARLIGTETTQFPLAGENREAAFQGLKDSVLRIAEEAHRQDVLIGIEPVALHTLNTPELTARLLSEVNSDHVKIILDPVNLFTLDNIGKSEQIIDACFQAFGDRIEVLHLKDITMITKDHGDTIQKVNDTFKWESIGEGIVNYQQILRYVKDKNVSLIREEASILNYQTDLKNIQALLNSI